MLYAVFAVMAAALLALDQWLKYWIVNHLELGESMPFIPHILQLERLHNYGAAFSSLTGKTAFLLGMTVVLLLVLAVLLVRKVVRHPLGVIACVLILGGGIGNMIDRCTIGVVTDFIDFCAFPNLWKWIFNIADCAVTIGGGMMFVWLIWSIIVEIKNKKNAVANPGNEHADDAQS